MNCWCGCMQSQGRETHKQNADDAHCGVVKMFGLKHPGYFYYNQESFKCLNVFGVSE